jgi:DNA-binding LytR/AlgR family response regulator
MVALITTVNVLTMLDDAHRRGAAMPLWWPLTLEISSGIAALITAPPIVTLAVGMAPPSEPPWWRTLAIHLVASIAFSVTHVGLMTLFRYAAFALQGHAYHWSLAELPYEYRKDLIAYVVSAGIVWAYFRAIEAPAPPASRATAAAPMTFDIRDGAALLRVPVVEILAAQAAGNYVEFALADGRRPLMRASMAQIETALAGAGFVRTHRSWLVNGACVRGLAPVGSGDFRVELAGGLTAPLSRRYGAALATLRGDLA